jgi:heme-degrading monooxygenase HmoA
MRNTTGLDWTFGDHLGSASTVRTPAGERAAAVLAFGRLRGGATLPTSHGFAGQRLIRRVDGSQRPPARPVVGSGGIAAGFGSKADARQTAATGGRTRRSISSPSPRPADQFHRWPIATVVQSATTQGASVIVRTWRGWTRPEDEDAYAEYVLGTGVAEYKRTPGNQGAYVISRPDGDRTEFMTISFWDDRESILAFAGQEMDRAVFYPEDDRYLIGRETTAKHFTVH